MELHAATAQVLQLIREHPGDLNAVFDGIARQAARLCGADNGAILRRDRDELVQVSTSAPGNASHIGDRFPMSSAIDFSRPFALDDLDTTLGRVVPVPVRSLLSVPLVVDGAHYGQLNVSRTEVRPFDARHTAIMETFAAHAVVAVQNARTFTELREALDLQTATSEVLRLISANPGDLRAVFQGIVTQAAQLCQAHSGSVQRIVGDELEFIAISSERAEFMIGTRVPRVLTSDHGPTYFTDIHAELDGPILSPARSLLTVPLTTAAGDFGRLTVSRLVVHPFEERHGRILQAFADQAAVAISNAGLFNALRETTDDLRDLNHHLAERVDEKVREVERLNTLRRFVSPQLAEAIASGAEGILASHRREITVLFCDLRGFTSFAETAEPEEVMAVLREFHDEVGPMIFEHQGTIAQFTGDGMLVFFNDPVLLDDPAWEAVQLAVRMRDRTAELSETWRRRGHDLTLGIGIAVGFATCGEIGFEGRTEYTAIGTVVNLAARICGIAAGDQILVTHRVHAAVEDRISSSALGDHDFRGLTRPVPLFEIGSVHLEMTPSDHV